MNHVKRAVIVAAGEGKRMRPITLSCPKPLVSVNGKRMIDTVINALNKKRVFEIYVVVGYLKEQFMDIANHYQGVTIIENSYYGECNNISSLYVARDYLEDSLIIDGDQIINNPDILYTDFEMSGYNAVYSEKFTDEWLMQVDTDAHVTSCSRTGGSDGWRLVSVSRWNSEDGKKLKHLLEYEFEERKNRDIYWDDVVMFNHFSEFNLTIYPMDKDDVVEIDSLDELIKLDMSYEEYMNHE